MNKVVFFNYFPPLLVSMSLFCTINVQNLTSQYFFYVVASCILVGVIVYKLFVSEIIEIPNNVHCIFLIFFVFFSTITIYWSPVSGNSFLAVSILYILPLSFFVGYWSNKKQQKYFQTFLIVIIFLICFKSIYQRFYIDPYLPPPGFFANKNTNAIFIGIILLPLCSGFFDKSKNQILPSIAVIIGIFVISLTTSRGAMLGLMSGVFMIVVYSALMNKSTFKSIKIILLFTTGYLFANYSIGTENLEILIMRTFTTDLNMLSSGRNFLWQAAWEMYLEKPYLGWGLDMFRWLYPQYKPVDNLDFGLYVHNDYLQFLVELGPLGLLLFLGFIFSFAFSCKKLFLLEKNNESSFFYIGLIAALLAVFIHSFFTFNFYQPAPLMLVGLYIGVLTKQLNQITLRNNIAINPLKDSSFLKVYYGSISAVVFIFMYFSFTQIFTQQKLYSDYENNIIYLEETEKAKFFVNYNENLFSIQLKIFVDLLYNVKNDLTAGGRDYLISKAIPVSDRAIEKNPYRVINYVNRAKILLASSAIEYPNKNHEIRRAYRKAIQVDPSKYMTRIEYVKVLMGIGDKVEAKKVLLGGLGRRYHGKHKDAIYYLQLLFALVSDSGSVSEKESLKRQIDSLQLRKQPKGYFSLNEI